MGDHGLSVTLSKTEIVLTTKKHIKTIILLRVGDLENETNSAAKYSFRLVYSVLEGGFKRQSIRLGVDEPAGARRHYCSLRVAFHV